jgi:hypothetical protein
LIAGKIMADERIAGVGIENINGLPEDVADTLRLFGITEFIFSQPDEVSGHFGVETVVDSAHGPRIIGLDAHGVPFGVNGRYYDGRQLSPWERAYHIAPRRIVQGLGEVVACRALQFTTIDPNTTPPATTAPAAAPKPRRRYIARY